MENSRLNASGSLWVLQTKEELGFVFLEVYNKQGKIEPGGRAYKTHAAHFGKEIVHIKPVVSIVGKTQ